MAKKQLIVNMIYGGSFHCADTVLDEEEIPPNLRKPEYLKEPERKRNKQQDFEEIETEELSFSDELPEEEIEAEAEEEEEPKPQVFRTRKKR